MGFDFTITTKEDLKQAILTYGFVPLFRNSIPGFSVEEHVDPSVWFGDTEGVWEWKGPVIREIGCAYGKFLENKAAFISAEWFPDFANMRRDGYDFEALFEDEKASVREKTLFDLIDATAPSLSTDLKKAGNYKKGGNVGFDTTMNHLQHMCYAIIRDFVYHRDKYGKSYGWGIAEVTTPEKEWGSDFSDRVYACDPKVSRERILAHFHAIFPEVKDEKWNRLLK